MALRNPGRYVFADFCADCVRYGASVYDSSGHCI